MAIAKKNNFMKKKLKKKPQFTIDSLKNYLT